MRLTIQNFLARYGSRRGAIDFSRTSRLLLVGSAITIVHLVLLICVKNGALRTTEHSSIQSNKQREIEVVFVAPRANGGSIGTPRLHGSEQLRRVWRKEVEQGREKDRQFRSDQVKHDVSKGEKIYRGDSSGIEPADPFTEYLPSSKLTQKTILKTFLGDKLLMDLPPESSGVVIVNLYINENGKVDIVQIDPNSEYTTDRATLDIIVAFTKNLEFEPGMDGHRATKTRFKMELTL